MTHTRRTAARRTAARRTAALAKAQARAEDTEISVSERRWWSQHARYLRGCIDNAPAYRALRAQAGTLGMAPAAFDRACKEEIDEDRAGDDSGEWIRAARCVVASLLPQDSGCPGYPEPDGAWERQQWERQQWYRACDAALQ